MVCIVTGSSRGLGKAVALCFGRKGHQVAVHYRERKEAVEEVASGIGESLSVSADVRNFEAVKECVDTVMEKWGTIDVLINNAGITRESLMLRTSERDFDDIVNTNLKGAFHFIKAAGRHMMKQKKGHIINVSSYAGIKGKEGLSAYSAAKAGLIGLTKTAARELSRYDIMVNAVLPGYMLTDMGTASDEKAREAALTEGLVKQFSDPENVSEFICNLSEMTGITGQVFNLDSRIL